MAEESGPAPARPPLPRLPRLTTEQVAARLGVRIETVYAYVSRGLLTSEHAAGRRASTFDALEVEALAARRRRSRSGGAPTTSGSPLMVIESAITLVEDDRLYYRGRDACVLARAHGFEEVASWLVAGELAPMLVRVDEGTDAAIRAAVAALPADAGLVDRMRVALVVAGSLDPLRFDTAGIALPATVRSIVAALVASLPATTGEGTVAECVVSALAAPEARPFAPVVDAALVLLLDHELAASTLAARVAASARAHPYAIVAAALGPLEGSLHGAASAAAHRMLAETVASGRADEVVAGILRAGARIPGFGHAAYAGEDPRALELLERLAGVPAAAQALAAVRAIEGVVRARTPLRPNVDLALGALTLAAGMRADAGEAVFAIARSVGWLAHALEEYGESPLRLRPTARYVGPPPAP